MADNAASVEVGALTLTDFVNPAGLQARGEPVPGNHGLGPAQNGNPGLNGLGTVVQGALEGSNVNVVEELVSMIETQRAYEMNAKAISTTDSMLGYSTTRSDRPNRETAMSPISNFSRTAPRLHRGRPARWLRDRGRRAPTRRWRRSSRSCRRRPRPPAIMPAGPIAAVSQTAAHAMSATC